MKRLKSPRYLIPFVLGLGATSASLSSGFIWACGSRCISDPIIWSPSNQWFLVFVAAFTAWWGYLVAHYASADTFIDTSQHNSENRVPEEDSEGGRKDIKKWFGVIFGAGILILGMVIGVYFIRRGNHLMTNVGGVLFLGGYVIAHYVETEKPL